MNITSIIDTILLYFWNMSNCPPQPPFNDVECILPILLGWRVLMLLFPKSHLDNSSNTQPRVDQRNLDVWVYWLCDVFFSCELLIDDVVLWHFWTDLKLSFPKSSRWPWWVGIGGIWMRAGLEVSLTCHDGADHESWGHGQDGWTGNNDMSKGYELRQRNTHILICSSWGNLADLLLSTNDEDLRRPPWMFAKVPRLSRTIEIARLQPSLLGLVVGRILGLPMRQMSLKNTSKGLLGRRWIMTPQGMATTPSTREIPHSRPPVGVTVKAAPPTKTMIIGQRLLHRTLGWMPRKDQNDAPMRVMTIK